MDKILTYAKAHVALLGAALTWYVAHYPNGQWVPYVSAALGVLTAVGVLVTPNKPKTAAKSTKPARRHPADHGYGLIELLVVVILILVIVGIVFRWH